MYKRARTWIVYLFVFGIIIAMVSLVNRATTGTPDELGYQEFVQLVKEDKIEAAVLTGYQLTGVYKDSYRQTPLTGKDLPRKFDFSVYIADREAFNNDMRVIASEKKGIRPEEISSVDYNFEYRYQKPADFSMLDIIPYVILFGGIIFLWYIIMQQQGGGKINSFGKSRAKVVTDGQTDKTFADVAGADEEKEELAEIVEFLKNPKRFVDLGARIPKGCLLVGPPGTGKTLLAKAVAGEAGAPFYSISGSDFVEMFVGVGASRVRDLFGTAKKTAPSIVFIDEIDAVGRHRGAGLGGGHDEREQTLNQLLVEMDGFAPYEGIIVIAATNRPDILDPALLRPGRFDRQITVNTPDVKGREDILRVHAKNKPMEADVDLQVLAKRTPGFTGADLENVLNEGAILAARRKKKKIGMQEIEESITRVIAGPQKRSRVITEEDKRITAYHEAGHAIIAQVLDCDKVHEVSIIQRGRAAGYTMTLPKEEKQHLSKTKLLDGIAMLMGGRVAEAIVIGDISTGAYNDIQRATDTARKMVLEYGMSDTIGPVFLGGDTEIFVGKDFGHQRNYSEDIAGKVDTEIRRILDEAFGRANEILEQHRDTMDRIVKVLLEREHIDGDEFVALFEGRDMPDKPQHMQTFEQEGEYDKPASGKSASDKPAAGAPAAVKPDLPVPDERDGEVKH